MYGLGINFDATFQSTFNALSSKASDIGTITAGVIGIAALFYFAYKTWGALSRNEAIELYPLLKPLVIIFVCLNFNTIVIAPSQYILSPFRTYTANFVKNTEQSTVDRIDNVINKSAEARKKQQKENPEQGFDIVFNIANAITGAFENFHGWILKGTLIILSWTKDAVYIIINFLRIFFLVVLAIIGPIAFALSLFPGFENSLTNWFSKYISIYLWAPICNILNLILSQTELVMVEKLITMPTSASVGDAFGSMGMIVMLSVFYLIGTCSYLSVPSISTWIVQGGASSLELASSLRGIKSALLYAVSAPAALAGRALGGLSKKK